jgi:hypothetical protein
MQAKRTAVVMKGSGGAEAARAEDVVVCSGFGVTGYGCHGASGPRSDRLIFTLRVTVHRGTETQRPPGSFVSNGSHQHRPAPESAIGVGVSFTSRSSACRRCRHPACLSLPGADGARRELGFCRWCGSTCASCVVGFTAAVLLLLRRQRRRPVLPSSRSNNVVTGGRFLRDARQRTLLRSIFKARTFRRHPQ